MKKKYEINHKDYKEEVFENESGKEFRAYSGDNPSCCYGFWDVYLCRHPQCPYCENFDRGNEQD